MKKSLTEILIEALVGKKIKLYKVLNKTHNPEGVEILYANTEFLPHNKNSILEVIGETHGTIQNLDTQDCGYEGDNYEFTIVDNNGSVVNVHGLHTITSSIEFLN